MVKVSVIIPVYNGANCVAKSIQSVLEQTYKDFEIVCINDGSSDNTAEVLKSFGNKIRIVDNGLNKGIGATRNVGIRKAKGEYLTYLSADDEFHPDFLAESMKAIEERPGCVTYADYVISQGGKLTVLSLPEFPDYNEMVMRAWISAELDSMFVCYSSMIFPTKLLKELPFIDELRYGEDLDHWLRLIIFKRPDLYHIRKPLMKYNIAELPNVTKARFYELSRNNDLIRYKILNELEVIRDGKSIS